MLLRYTWSTLACRRVAFISLWVDWILRAFYFLFDFQPIFVGAQGLFELCGQRLIVVVFMGPCWEWLGSEPGLLRANPTLTPLHSLSSLSYFLRQLFDIVKITLGGCFEKLGIGDNYSTFRHGPKWNSWLLCRAHIMFKNNPLYQDYPLRFWESENNGFIIIFFFLRTIERVSVNWYGYITDSISSIKPFFFFSCGRGAMKLRAYSWLHIQGSLLVMIGILWDTGDQTWVSCVQNKFPTHYTIAPAWISRFWL